MSDGEYDALVAELGKLEAKVDALNEKIVTPRQLAAAAATCVAICITVVMFGWNIHTAQPHKGAVQQHELDRVLKQLDRIENRLTKE